jgi:hypothetical protein
MRIYKHPDGAPDAARLGRVELAGSHRYGRRSPRPIRLVRRIRARTPTRIKPLDAETRLASVTTMSSRKSHECVPRIRGAQLGGSRPISTSAYELVVSDVTS